VSGEAGRQYCEWTTSRLYSLLPPLPLEGVGNGSGVGCRGIPPGVLRGAPVPGATGVTRTGVGVMGAPGVA
jgi:hypothetical protein